jgi:hypothetical protein
VNEGAAKKIRAAGGEIYAISSEPQSLAGRAARDWKLDFETLGDPHHEVSGACRERGWIDLFVNERLEFLQASTRGRDFEPTHPKGYFQPGVLAIRQDGRVLYRWRSIPSHSNVGGALERPTAAHVWREIELALESDLAEDAALDASPPLDSKGLPWPIFAPLLIANGWFMGARGFASTRHIAFAAGRLLAFVGAWIAAFVWLPTLPVAVGLAGWIAFITPKVRWVGREFQDASG